MIKPHGGKLIDRIVKDKVEFKKKAEKLKKIYIDKWTLSDIEMIGIGGFSPLEGFINKKDYISVIENMRLTDGTIWPLPITLSISDEEKNEIKSEKEISLYYKNNPIAIMEIEEIYDYDKEKEAEFVYGTKSETHPGVKRVYSQKKYLCGGKINVIDIPENEKFKKYYMTPSETRKIFQEMGWKKIVAFQTRNPIHRAHEYIIKCALEICDGLFLHPIIGETKKDDIPADLRMKCYEVLIERYFPKNRVLLCVNPSNMRYAGPREAIFHAIVRKNYGATHFIVGRDHAGVGNFYGPYDAQKIFDDFKPEEIGIVPLCFENAFYCKGCGAMATIKTCPHPDEYHFSLSGTKVRELLSSGEIPPKEFTRPEISEILINWYRDIKNG